MFRTYNASITLERELAKMPESLKNATPNEKIAFYNACNRAVAILCNHKKTVSKSFGESMAKIEAKVLFLQLVSMLNSWLDQGIRETKKEVKATIQILERQRP